MKNASSIQITLNALLAVYFIVPLCLLIVVIDQLFWGGYLRQVIPQNPEKLFLYSLIFIVPHIVASFFSLAEKEYLQFYKRQLLYEVPVLVVLSMLMYVYAYNLAFMAVVVYTMYHQVSQQYGIGRFYFRTHLPEYNVWRLTAVAIAVIGYGLAYRGSLFSSEFAYTYLLPLGVILDILFVWLSFRIYRRLRDRAGVIYFLMLVGAMFGESLLLFAGYPFFVIFCTRVVHDIPAFMAYIMHDHNRKKDGGENLLYCLFAFARVPIFLLSPFLAIGIAFVVVRIPMVAAELVFVVGMVHYYLEGFIWKGGSIHRRYLHFVG